MVKQGKIKRFRLWLSKIIKGSNPQSFITDEQRQQALMVRRQEHALKQAEKQLEFMERLNKLEFAANPKESVTDSLLKQAMPILLAKIANEKAVNIQPQPTAQHQNNTETV